MSTYTVPRRYKIMWLDDDIANGHRGRDPKDFKVVTTLYPAVDERNLLPRLRWRMSEYDKEKTVEFLFPYKFHQSGPKLTSWEVNGIWIYTVSHIWRSTPQSQMCLRLLRSFIVTYLWKKRSTRMDVLSGNSTRVSALTSSTFTTR